MAWDRAPVLEFFRDWLGEWTIFEPEPNPAGVPSGEGYSEKSEDASDHWFVTFWLNLLFKVADTGFVYCGALCASVGYAAKWAYWLAVAVVGVFCLQLAVWTISWVVIPVFRHAYAFYRYLTGQGPWHEVVRLHGFSSFRPKWKGPATDTPWTAQYVQQEVRGRSENREPLDLLVSDGVAVARLRHGALRGRTDRHGYLARCNSVHSSSHRYWRNQIEVAECSVHLCSADPCTAPDCAEVHVGLSAVAPRSEEVDLQEAAGKGALARCWTVTSFWGCLTCGAFRRCVSSCCKNGKRTCRWVFCCCLRRASRPGNSSTGRRDLHDDSETESEGGEGDHICQADQVAFGGPESKGPLSLGPCKDCSCGPPIRLLQPDERTSCTEDLICENDGYYFRACQRHRDMYEASRAKRACAVEGCNNAARSVLKGVRLCKLHATKEEKGPKTQNEGKGHRAVGDIVQEAERENTTPMPAARSAPGQGGDGVRVSQPASATQEDSKDLAAYLQARLNGESHSVALLSTAKRDESLTAAGTRLTEAAKASLPKLPPDYPEEVAQLIRSLAGAREREEMFDPILELGKKSLVQTAAEPPRPVEERKPEPSVTHSAVPAPSFGVATVAPPRVSAALLFRQKEAHQGAAGDSGSVVPLPDGLVSALRPSRAGAFTEPEARPTDDTARALQTIAKTLSARDESTSHDKGKLASIGRPEERLVFIVRGCDSLTVPVCACTTGKELFHSLKTAGAQGRPQMRALQFPVNVTNRIAYGLAALSIGGREVKSLPEYSLSVADFPLTSEEDFDNFVPPPDSRLEKRPRHPTTLTAWFRAALRMAWAVACVYGTEHYALFEAAATKLLHLGEEATYAWPLPWVMSTWEELWSRMVEELRQLDREMRRLMGEESPSWERIRFFCTSPDDQGNPWLRLPRTFDLEDPKEFFSTDIVPRHQRALTRNCWQQALKAQGLGTTAQLGGGRAGGDPPDEGITAATRVDAGEASRAGEGTKQGELAGTPAVPKLQGPPLTAKEASRALDHRPKAREGGGYLCWDHMSHRGCHLGTKCPHAHPSASQIPAWNSLDWSVQLQLLRRGGLKTKPKTKSVDAAVAALRREVARKQRKSTWRKGNARQRRLQRPLGPRPTLLRPRPKQAEDGVRLAAPRTSRRTPPSRHHHRKSSLPLLLLTRRQPWPNGRTDPTLPGLPTNQPPPSERWTLPLSPERASGLRRGTAPGPWTLWLRKSRWMVGRISLPRS